MASAYLDFTEPTVGDALLVGFTLLLQEEKRIQKAGAHILGQEREVDWGWVVEWGQSMLKKMERGEGTG